MLHWRKVRPDLLRPYFSEAVIDLLAPAPYHWFVTFGFRTLEEQATLYQAWRAHLKGGPFAGKAAPPGKSAHNYGLAVDIVLDADPALPGLQPTWSTKLAGWLWLKTKLMGHPVLKHGLTFGDWPHIEWRQWKGAAGV